MVESPCVGFCKTNEKGVCVGCFRTLEEIRQWQTYSDKMRSAILEDVEERKRYSHMTLD